MTLDQLKYALELERTRHFSKAAENCHITQPSLSVQIAKLEEELGFSLFVRTRGGVELTEYGESVLAQARVIVNESERLTQMASDLKGEVRGQFRLGIIPTLAPSLLPLFVREFGRSYPAVELLITEDKTANLVRDIDRGLIDGAILSTPSKSPDSLIEKVLFYEPFVLFASKGHSILDRKKISIDDLSSEDILLLDETHCLRDQVLQICRAKLKAGRGVEEKFVRFRLQSASLQTLIEFIRFNEGFTLLPALAAELLSPAEKIKCVRVFEKPLPSRKVSLVFHQARLKRSILEALKESILKSLPEQVFLANSRSDVRVLSPSLEHFEI